MSYRPDLALYNGNGRLTAIAEVKKRFGTSGDWAARMRRNIVAHGAPPDSDYFLLVTPDRLYLWHKAGSEPAEIPPTFIADTEPAFAPYFKSAGIDAGKISGAAFELLVAAWLSDLTRSPKAAVQSASSPGWLEESGFRAAVQDGQVEYEVAV